MAQITTETITDVRATVVVNQLTVATIFSTGRPRHATIDFSALAVALSDNGPEVELSIGEIAVLRAILADVIKAIVTTEPEVLPFPCVDGEAEAGEPMEDNDHPF